MDQIINIDLSQICRQELCENYIEWEFEIDMVSGSQYLCSSCMVVGQSYHVYTYPEICSHKEKIIKYREERIEQMALKKLKNV